MQLVLIQIGQCGNQVGATLLDHLFSAMSLKDPCIHQFQHSVPVFEMNTFFRRSEGQWVARAIAVDAESKVLQRLPSSNLSLVKENQKKLAWIYEARNKIYDYTGSANNWAYGCVSQLTLFFKADYLQILSTCEKVV